ncbi:hypothetical protein ACO2Q0_10690 [Phenylobacterium sp. VNQ135]|uniref:hypothetical protein n=1 Tax=Phenylobacterium sp. VNQ135 TaxID=3400922 RepID=UPI003C02C0BE
MPKPAASALILAAVLALPARADAPLTEADARALVARQAARLNAGDLDGYLATFAPSAVFTQQALGSNNQLIPYGQATVRQARDQLGRTLAKSQVREAVEVRKVAIGAAGRGGALQAFVRTRVTTAGRIRESCAERLSTFARIGGGLRVLAQTDTLVRCRRPA